MEDVRLGQLCFLHDSRRCTFQSVPDAARANSSRRKRGRAEPGFPGSGYGEISSKFVRFDISGCSSVPATGFRRTWGLLGFEEALDGVVLLRRGSGELPFIFSPRWTVFVGWAVVHHRHRVVIPARTLVLKISAVWILNRGHRQIMRGL